MPTTMDYQSKIAALLAKAEGTDNEHERDAFTKKAQALMLKHGIDEATARAKKASAGEKITEKIVTKTVPMKTRYGRGFMSIGFAVCRNMSGLRAYKINRTNSEEGTLFVVGFETDVDHAIQLIESLKLQATSAANRHFKTDEGKQEIAYEMAVSGKSEARSTWKAKRTFLTYFGQGAGQRIAEVWGEVTKNASKSTELAIVDRQAQVDSWLDAHVKLGKGRSFGTGAAGAGSGYSAGQKADVGGRGVTTGNNAGRKAI